MADLYAVMMATEYLESAFVRDVVSNDVYETECQRLIAQYKVSLAAVSDIVRDPATFMLDNKMHCKRAAIRLIEKGIPATLEHKVTSSNAQTGQLSVLMATQNFITTMDSLKLDMRAVDQLHPYLSDLVDALNKVPQLSAEHPAVAKVKEWLFELNKMRAHDELDDDQARQMTFDLEQAYNTFHSFVRESSK
jgi:ESCRT-I complex subunit VPS28